jgi:hypothetical protein
LSVASPISFPHFLHKKNVLEVFFCFLNPGFGFEKPMFWFRKAQVSISKNKGFAFGKRRFWSREAQVLILKTLGFRHLQPKVLTQNLGFSL